MTTAIWPNAQLGAPLTLRSVVVAACALLSTGAAVIHFAVLGEHWDEWWGYGLFFGIAAWLQLGWAAVVVARPSSKLLVAGAVGSFAIAVLWLVTRTEGVPAGPAFGETESAAFPDVLASVFEVLLGLSALAVVAAPAKKLTLRRWVGGVAILAVAAGVVTMTTVGLIEASSGGGHGDEESTGNSHDHARTSLEPRDWPRSPFAGSSGWPKRPAGMEARAGTHDASTLFRDPPGVRRSAATLLKTTHPPGEFRAATIVVGSIVHELVRRAGCGHSCEAPGVRAALARLAAA